MGPSSLQLRRGCMGVPFDKGHSMLRTILEPSLYGTPLWWLISPAMMVPCLPLLCRTFNVRLRLRFSRLLLGAVFICRFLHLSV